jgi:hypothetical protein
MDDVAELLGERLHRYIDLWDEASAKLSASTYHAQRLVPTPSASSRGHRFRHCQPEVIGSTTGTHRLAPRSRNP